MVTARSRPQPTQSLGERLPRHLRLRELRVFVAVIEHRSFRKAAAALHITQPAVTKAIAGLEALLGVRLFDRTATGAEPTVHGESFARHAIGIFDELSSAARQLETVSRGDHGLLRVGVVPMPALIELPVAVSALAIEHPHVAVTLVEEPEQALIDLLRRREVDVVFTRGVRTPAADDLNVERLFDVWLCVYAGRHHPLASRPVLAWNDLLQWPWVMPPADAPFRRSVQRALETAHLPMPDRIVESVSVHMQYKMALQGLALSFGLRPSRPANGTSGDLLVKLPVKLPEIVGAVCAITLRRHEPTPLAQQLVARVRAQVPAA